MPKKGWEIWEDVVDLYNNPEAMAKLGDLQLPEKIVVKCEKPLGYEPTMLCAVAPGVHPPFQANYKRIIKMNSKDFIYQMASEMSLHDMLVDIVEREELVGMFPFIDPEARTNPCCEIFSDGRGDYSMECFEDMDVTAKSICHEIGSGPEGEDGPEVKAIQSDLYNTDLDFPAVVERLMIREQATLVDGGYTGRYKHLKAKALADRNWIFHAEMAVAEIALRMWDEIEGVPPPAVKEAISTRCKTGIQDSRNLHDILDANEDLLKATSAAAEEERAATIKAVAERTYSRPATAEDIADVQAQLAQVARDPNLTLYESHSITIPEGYHYVSEAEMSAKDWSVPGGSFILNEPKGHPFMKLHDKGLMSEKTLLDKFGLDYSKESQAITEPLACEHDFINSFQTGKPWCRKCGESRPK